MHEKHLGSTFEDFLREEGTLEETTNRAIKRVLARQLRQRMDEQGLSKSEMARRMRTSRPALERLLDPDNDAVTLNTLQKAARAVGRELRLELVRYAHLKVQDLSSLREEVKRWRGVTGQNRCRQSQLRSGPAGRPPARPRTGGGSLSSTTASAAMFRGAQPKLTRTLAGYGLL